jgi:hypothetical protein
MSVVLSLMAIGSRWDATHFVALSVFMVFFHISWTRFPNRRRIILTAATGMVVATSALLAIATPVGLNLALLFRFSEGQRNNLVFLSEYLLGGLPNALGALGSVPAMSPLPLPDFIYISAITVLGLLLALTYHSSSKLQVVGFGVIAVVISLVVAAQVSLMDNRDSGGVEPRYVYPLLLLAAAWWYLTGSQADVRRVQRYINFVVAVNTLNVFLLTYTVAERSVDYQSSGLRYLPEGPDQWWWTGIPFGPNVVVGAGTIFAWKFFGELGKVFRLTVNEHIN